MGSIYEHGVPPKSIRNITLSTHDWGRSDEWPDGSSEFVIRPDPGEIWVLRECYMKFSSGMDFGPDNNLIIEGGIDGMPSTIPITTYENVRDFIKRADDMKVVDLMAAGGGIIHPVVEVRLYFSEQVILWSSAGIVDGAPNVDVVGSPKLSSLSARLGDNSPFTMADDSSVPDLAVCRYFITAYEDQDYED
jgi:hypothetical protein